MQSTWDAAGAGAASGPDAAVELLQLAAFTCPRCGSEAQERFYGPCSSCRGELVAMMGGESREVERSSFEPRANVVANHVATKD